MKNKLIKTFGIVITASALVFTISACTGANPIVPSINNTSEVVTSEVASPTTQAVEKDSEKISEVASEEEKETEGAIAVDYQFFSETENNPSMVNIPQTIKRDGKEYVYTGNAEYKVSEVMEVVETTVDIEIEEINELDRTISYKSPSTGKVYTLSVDDEMINWGEPVKIHKKVTETVDWGTRMDAVEIPPVRAITYFNKYTNQEETVSGTLVSKVASEPFWAAAEEPITGTFSRSQGGVDHYDTSLITPEGKQFSVPLDNGLEGAYPSWNGYQSDVLKILGLDASKYRVTGCQWKDAPYWGTEFYPPVNKNVAVEYRDAIYPYEALVRTFRATYEAEGESLGYKTEVTYYSPVDVLLKKFKKEDIQKDISKLYKVTATATYREQ